MVLYPSYTMQGTSSLLNKPNHSSLCIFLTAPKHCPSMTLLLKGLMHYIISSGIRN